LIENDPAVIRRFQELRQSAYEDIRPLTWQQMREMAANGMEWGAHTYSHPNLALLSRRAANHELRHSKDVLEQRLGRPVEMMAYPFGKPRRHFTSETVSLVAETGYECAAAVLFRGIRPSDSKFTIPRIFVRHDNIETLREKVLGWWDIVGGWQQAAPLWAAKLISPQDFLV
jgi:peptidoglycan/xylan/chitin deacetylase (PgdA/CDA1 family)